MAQLEEVKEDNIIYRSFSSTVKDKFKQFIEQKISAVKQHEEDSLPLVEKIKQFGSSPDHQKAYDAVISCQDLRQLLEASKLDDEAFQTEIQFRAKALVGGFTDNPRKQYRQLSKILRGKSQEDCDIIDLVGGKQTIRNMLYQMEPYLIRKVHKLINKIQDKIASKKGAKIDLMAKDRDIVTQSVAEIKVESEQPSVEVQRFPEADGITTLQDSVVSEADEPELPELSAEEVQELLVKLDEINQVVVDPEICQEALAEELLAMDVVAHDLGVVGNQVLDAVADELNIPALEQQLEQAQHKQEHVQQRLAEIQAQKEALRGRLPSEIKDAVSGAKKAVEDKESQEKSDMEQDSTRKLE